MEQNKEKFDADGFMKGQRKLRIRRVGNIERFKKVKERYILPIEVRIKKIKKIKDVKVFLVDGKKIRNFIDIDFTMGGHGFRYVYIPLDEIWIDSSNESEKEEIFVHEIAEFELMKNGTSYDEAHELASLEEIKNRMKKIILPVGHHRQISNWSCGPSALKIVLDYYGDKKDVEILIEKTGCNKKDGTFHRGFRNVLKEFDYRFVEKQNASIEDIEEFLRAGIPVIVDYKDHHGGHFSVVIGYDEKKLFFSDPALDKKYKQIYKKDFEKRWYEEDEPKVVVKKWLLAIKRKTKKGQ